MNDEFLLRASELSQPAPDNHFLRMFGQSSRDLVNDSSVEGSIPQSLMLMNGDVQNLLYDREARLSKMLLMHLAILSPPFSSFFKTFFFVDHLLLMR